MSRSAVQELAGPVEAAIAEVGGDGVEARLERPADPAHGDYATAAALQLAKPLRSAPRQIAEKIAERIDSPFIASAEVAGPGFVNLRATPAWYRHVVQTALDRGRRFGAGAAAHPQKIQVEYVSGNPTGPVTASTARNAAYGDSLARLFEFAGHEVQREYYFNDAGRQMDLFGASLRARARGEDVPEDGYRGAYIEDIARDIGLDPDAPADEWRARGVEMMVDDIKRTLARFRAGFDRWFLERSLYEDGSVERAIEAVRSSGHTYEKDGALWLRSSDLGDDKDRVLVRTDGTPTYIAGDLGYIVSKLERGFDVAVYVLGSDHHGYIGRLKAGAIALGYDPDRIDVQLYQFVKIVEGGKAVSASKRRGTVLMLDELLDAIGVDAARFALVQRSHDQLIELDLELLGRSERREPGLLLPVRPRPHRGDPAQRGRGAGRARADLDSRAGRGRPREAPGRVPRRGGRGRRVARAAPHRRLRAGDGQVVPPVLQAVPRARRGDRRRAEPARAVPRGGHRHGGRARPGWGRGARADVTLEAPGTRCYPEPP